MKILSYIRVSSVGQVERDGFERQRESILKWVKGQKLKVVSEYREEGVSGTKDGLARPAMAAMLLDIEAMLQEGHQVAVVVEKADRFARDLIVSELLLRQFRELGVQVFEAEGGNELTAGTENPTSTLIRHVLSAVAEFEKSSLVLKLRAARERKKKETGRCGGRYPFGHYPGEKETLDLMLKMHAAGSSSTRAIAATLNSEGRPSRGGNPWTHGAVARILKNQKP